MLMVSTTLDECNQVFMVMGEDVSKSVVCVREGEGDGGRERGRKWEREGGMD